MAILSYLGRAISLTPAELGERFHNLCTVDVVEQDPPSAKNGWRRSQKVVPRELFWYDENGGTRYFCCFPGYADAILSALRGSGIEVTEQDMVDTGLGDPDLAAVKGTIWRPRQTEVVSAILAHRGGLIKAPMAFGKTFLIKKLSQLYPKAKIIVTVTSKDIANGIYEDLVLQIPDLGMVGGGKKNQQRVTVALAQSLHHCDPKASLVLADEVHCFCTDNLIEKLNQFPRAKMFGFSATLTGRSDKADGLLTGVFGPVRVEVDYQEAVGQGSIVNLHAYLVRVSEGPSVDGVSDKVKVDRLGIWQNTARNGIVAKAVRSVCDFLGPEGQVLVMVDKIEHAYRLGQLLPEFAIVTGELTSDRAEELQQMGVLAPGQRLCSVEDRETYRKDFESNRLKRAIATKIWSKGVDFRDLRALVRADGLASGIDANQVPGRLSRLGKETDKEYGILVDFFDNFADNLRGRSYARLRVYKENGWDIKTISPRQLDGNTGLLFT